MKEIQLTQGRIALVDDKDYDELSAHKWGCTNCGYAFRREHGSRKSPTVYMHVVIQGKKEGFHVDHINGNRLDNRRCNLRYATPSQNAYNIGKKKNGTSKYRGVFWNKATKSWRSSIVCDGKKYSLGCYKDEEDAKLVYNVWARYLYGEYARINV